VNKSVKKSLQRFLGNFIAVVMLFTSILTGNVAVFAADEGSADAKADVPTVWLIGDSTVCNYTTENVEMYNYRQGWGMRLGDYFKDGSVNIKNIAISGRAVRDFRYLENYKDFEANAKAGDYVFIQLGHNDEKDPLAKTTYATSDYGQNDEKLGRSSAAMLPNWQAAADENGYVALPNLITELKKLSTNITDESLKGSCYENGKVPSYEAILYKSYVKKAIDMGLQPVLVTPIIRSDASSNGVVNGKDITLDTLSTDEHEKARWSVSGKALEADTGKNYADKSAGINYIQAMKDVATYAEAQNSGKKVPVIDLYAGSVELWSQYLTKDHNVNALHANNDIDNNKLASEQNNPPHKDRTHLSRLGAFKAAGIVAEGIKKDTNLAALAANLKETFPTEPLDNVGGGSTEPDTSEPDSGEPDTSGGNEPDTGWADKDDRGEIDGKGIIDCNDASVLLSYVLSKSKDGIAASYSDEMLMYMGDVNSDGIISAADVSEILKRAIDGTFEFTGAKGEKPVEDQSQDESENENESSSGGVTPETSFTVSGTAKNASKVELVGEETTYKNDSIGTNGEFSIENVKKGTYDINVTATGYTVTGIAGTGVSGNVNDGWKVKVENDNVSDIVVTLQKNSSPDPETGATVSGTFADEASKGAFSTIKLAPATGSEIEGTVSNDGVAFAGKVPAGVYTIKCEMNANFVVDSITLGSGSQGTLAAPTGEETEYKLTVADGQTVALVFKAKADTSVETKYTVNGTVDAGVDSVKFNNTAVTIAESKFTVDNLETNEEGYALEITPKSGYQVKEVKAGETALEANEQGVYSVPVSGSETTIALSITTEAIPVYTVSGTAENAKVVTLTLKEDKTKKYDSAEISSGNTFTIANVPAGVYTISATGNGNFKYKSAKIGETDCANNELTIENDNITGLTITMEAFTGVAVSGNCGEGIDSIVFVDSTNEDTTFTATITPGTEGTSATYTASVPAGKYKIQVNYKEDSGYGLDSISGGSEYASGVLNVESTAITGLNITSKKTSAKVSGTATGKVKNVILTAKAENNPEVIVYSVAALASEPLSAKVNDEGKFEFATVPNGDYIVSAVAFLGNKITKISQEQGGTQQQADVNTLDITVAGEDITNIKVEAAEDTDNLVKIGGKADVAITGLTFKLVGLPNEEKVPTDETIEWTTTLTTTENQSEPNTYAFDNMVKGTYEITVTKSDGAGDVKVMDDSTEVTTDDQGKLTIEVDAAKEKLNFTIEEAAAKQISGTVKFDFAPDKKTTVIVNATPATGGQKAATEVSTKVEVEANAESATYTLTGVENASYTVSAEVSTTAPVAGSTEREFKVRSVEAVTDGQQVEEKAAEATTDTLDVEISDEKPEAKVDVNVGEIVLMPYGVDFESEAAEGESFYTKTEEVGATVKKEAGSEGTSNSYLVMEASSAANTDYLNFDIGSYIPEDKELPVELESNSEIVVAFDIRPEIDTTNETVTEYQGYPVFELVGELAPSLEMKKEANTNRYAALVSHSNWAQLDFQDNSANEVAQIFEGNASSNNTLKFFNDAKPIAKNNNTNKWYNVTYVIDYENDWLTGKYGCGDNVAVFADCDLTNVKGEKVSGVKGYHGSNFDENLSIIGADKKAALNLTFFPTAETKGTCKWDIDNIKVYVKGWKAKESDGTAIAETIDNISKDVKTIKDKYNGLSTVSGKVQVESKASSNTEYKVVLTDVSSESTTQTVKATIKKDATSADFAFNNTVKDGTYYISVENQTVELSTEVGETVSGVEKTDDGKIKVTINGGHVTGVVLKITTTPPSSDPTEDGPSASAASVDNDELVGGAPNDESSVEKEEAVEETSSGEEAQASEPEEVITPAEGTENGESQPEEPQAEGDSAGSADGETENSGEEIAE